MPPPIRVALVGLTDFEAQALEAWFRLGPRRGVGYELVRGETTELLAGAALIVADGEQPERVARVAAAGRIARCLLIGGPPRADAGAVLARPISPVQLARALDTMPGLHAEPAPSPNVQRVLDELASLVHTSPGRLDSVLVVDDDAAALRFLAVQMDRIGFEARLAFSADEALACVAKRRFEFAFVARTLGDGAPGFGADLIRRIRQACREAGRRSPCLVMLVPGDAPAAEADALADGADAALRRPLKADEVLALVGAREARRYAFVDTAEPTTLF